MRKRSPLQLPPALGHVSFTLLAQLVGVSARFLQVSGGQWGDPGVRRAAACHGWQWARLDRVGQNLDAAGRWRQKAGVRTPWFYPSASAVAHPCPLFPSLPLALAAMPCLRRP